MESLVEGVTYLRDFETFRSLLPPARRWHRPAALPAHPIGDRARRRRLPLPGRRPRRAPRREPDAATRARSSRSSAPTAPARARSPSCCAGSCRRRPGRSCWDGIDVAAYAPAERPSPRRSRLPGLHPLRAHRTRGDRLRRHRSDRRRRSDRRGRPPRRGRRLHRPARRRIRHPAVDVVHRRHRTLRRSMAADGDRPGVLPRRAARRDGRTRRRRSTPAPNATCSNGSPISGEIAWSCSSRTASPPCAAPTRSSCCSTVASPSSGTHDDLMALGGVYAELYSMQAEQFG